MNPLEMNPLEMNGLPELALIKIFDCLPLYDQLSSARLVCKKWKLLIEQDNLTNSRSELVLFLRMERRPLIWSHNQQPVDLMNSLISNSLINGSTRFGNRLTTVKRLYIAMWELNFDSNQICNAVNQFSNVEHLEINNMYVLLCDRTFISEINVDFNLPKLQTLYLGNNDRLVNLNCPALTRLSVFDAFHWNETLSRTLNQLRFLKVCSFSHEPGLGMANLEVLMIADDLQIDLDLFPKLREVHYYLKSASREHSDVRANVSGRPEQEAALLSLFERKVQLGRNLKVYCDGLRCDTLQELATAKRNVKLYSPVTICRTDYRFTEDFDLISKGSFDRIKLEDVKRSLNLFRPSQLKELNSLSAQTIEHTARALEHSEVDTTDIDSFFERDSFRFDDPSFLKLKAFFRYATVLRICGPWSQISLNKLPDLMPNTILLSLQFGWDLNWTTKNLSFLSRFPGLKKLVVEKYLLSLDLLRMLFINCRFLDRLIIMEEEFELWVFVSPFGEDGFQIWFQQFPDDEHIVSSREELLDFLDRNWVLKRHFFDDYFSKNYCLDMDYQLDPISYFNEQEH